MKPYCVWAAERVDERGEQPLSTLVTSLPEAWRRYVGDVEQTVAMLRRAVVAVLLRRVLSQKGINADKQGLSHRENGQPYLPDCPDLSVSVSHCRGCVAVAVAEGTRVGIDIESPRRINPLLVERVLSVNEQRLLSGSDHFNNDFLLLWTRKESALKYFGTGIKGFASLVNVERDFSGRWVQLTDLPTGIVGHLALDSCCEECYNVSDGCKK